MTWKELLEEFGKDIRSTKAENTIKSYEYAISRWDFPDKPDKEMVRARLSKWKGTMSNNTIILWGQALKYVMNNYYDEFPSKTRRDIIQLLNEVKPEKAVVVTAKKSQVEEVIYSSEPRWAVCVALMFYAGLRLNEVYQLDISEINFDENYIFIPVEKSKTRVARQVPLHHSLKKILKGYIKLSRPGLAAPDIVEATDRLIITANGPAAYSYIMKKVKESCRGAGFDALHDHAFRRGFGTTLGKNGVNLEKIRDLMGHEDVSTTSRYVDFDLDDKREDIEAI